MKINILKITVLMLFVAGSFGSCENNGEENIRLVSCSQIIDYPERETDLCTDELCVRYQKIWKELFIKRNGLTEAYFDKHIELSYSSIHDWNDGTSFDVCYYVKTDWAKTYQCDGFIIKTKADNTLIPLLDIPRGELLEKEDIEKTIEMHAFGSGITKLTSDETLKFKTLDDALDFLIKEAKVNTLCPYGETGVHVDKESGHLCLDASAQYNDEFNKCIYASLDLINGEFTITDGQCYIE